MSLPRTSLETTATAMQSTHLANHPENISMASLNTHHARDTGAPSKAHHSSQEPPNDPRISSDAPVLSEKVSVEPPASKHAGSSISQDTKVAFDPYAGFTDHQRAILESQAAVPPPRKVSFLELFRYQTRFEGLINSIGVFCAIVSGAAQPLMTVVFGALTTDFTNYFAVVSNGGTPDEINERRSQVLHSANHNVLYLVYIGLATVVVTYIYEYAFTTSAETNARRIRERYYESVLRQNIAYFDKLGPGEVSTRIESDCHLIQDGIGDKIPISFTFIAMFCSGFIVAYVRNWRLALAMSSIVPVITIAGFAMNAYETKHRRRMLDYVSQGGNLAEEFISSIRTVFAFGNQERLAQRYDVVNVAAQKIGRQVAIGHASGLGVFFFVIYGSYGLAFYFGTTLFLNGHATSGEIVNVFFAILIGAFSLAQLPPNLEAVALAQGAASKLFDTIDRVPPIDSASPEGKKLPVRGQIEFDNVDFYYPSRPSVKVLDRFSIIFQQGETTALVGASGAGKSSVVGIIERFYNIVDGQVRLDGHDITDLNIKHLRRNIGLVSQEPVLFSGTIYENVAHGLLGSAKESASKEEKRLLVEEACKKSNAHNFVSALPDGYDTRIGERGALLSGGQRQRISIARAIIKNPPILLLDEATSALDTESERLVQAAIDDVSVGRTTIVIAHRLSTIRGAHKIVVMGQGRVLEAGTHQQLLENPEGAYSSLVHAQRIKEANTKDRLDIGPNEKDLLEKEAALAGAGALTRSLTAVSASSQALRNKPQKEGAKEPGNTAVAIRLARLNGSSKWTYIVGIFASFIVGSVYPSFGIVFGFTLQIYSSNDRHYVRDRGNFWALMCFVIALGATVSIWVQAFCFHTASENLSRKLRLRTLKTILSQDVAFFDEDKNSSGSLTSQIADHAQQINPLAGSTLGVIIQNIFTLVVGIIIGLSFLPKLAAVGLACVPFAMSAGLTRLWFVVMSEAKLKAAHQDSAQLACEGASAIRTVQSLTREEESLRLYSEHLEKAQGFTFRTAIYSNLLYSVAQGLSYWIIGLVFWYGSRLLVNDGIEPKAFFICSISVTFSSIQVGQIFNFVPSISGSLNAAKTLVRLFDSPKLLDPAESTGTTPPIEGHIRFEDVHFRYPTRSHVPVLRGVELECKPGQFVALCGPSGSGKSTIIQLIERYYDPLAGRITVDGQDLGTLDIRDYRSQLAVVAQESHLYLGTIRENILLGSPKPPEEVTEEELWGACREANIAQFIKTLPDGMDTDLGGKGTQLSGGQRSRICLARALIRNPKVLLLDEATSALDSESEKVVQEALDKAAKGRTTLAVAHRLSTIQNADLIYVLKDGRVAEKGTHDSLMEKRALYYELVAAQTLAA